MSTAVCIRCSQELKTLSTIPASSSRAAASTRLRRSVHERAHLLTADNPLKILGIAQVEDNNREPVVHAQRQRGAVHNLQAQLERLHVAQPGELSCPRGSARVGIVDAVDAV